MDTNFFVNWYKEHGRRFPWREEGISPFAILVTEMLLRQTRATSVARVWSSFIGEYGDPEALSSASELELRVKLKELGFANQRTQALKSAATWLMQYHGGRVPATKEKLLNIPHIGLYSAHAILCFAFKQQIEIVDTNIVRFIARHYNLKAKTDIRRCSGVWELARLMLPTDKRRAWQHNYGLLDFCADVCKPRQSKCTTCPLALSCYQVNNS